MIKKRIHKMMTVLGCLFLQAAIVSAEQDPVPAARALVERVAPLVAGEITLESIPSADGLDVFELESVGGKVVLRGNNGVSLAGALNRYLNEYCKCEFSLWGGNMNMPEKAPLVPEKIRVVNPRKIRHFFNYCTFNYSGSWWDWDEWERVIDFMALHGINTPLSIVGVEAVWYHTLIELGFTDLEARSFIAAPVYLNWQWMGNLEGSGGPIPKSWIDSHEKLGKRIFERQLALGMKPIANGFAGVVPRLMKEKFPEAGIKFKGKWGGGSFDGAAQLDPMDPLFKTIGEIYLKQHIQRIGTGHYYMADPFHESGPPVDGDEYLAQVGRAISDLISSVDPQGIWMMQDWSLRTPVAKAVDKDKLIIMNLHGDHWRKANAKGKGGYRDWGYKFTVGQISNFGGRTHMHGDLRRQAGNTFAVARSETENCIGSGMWMEGLEDNPVNYHLALDMMWKAGPVDLDAWFADWTERRYGGRSEKAHQAWKLAAKGPFTRGGFGYSSMVAARPALAPKKSGPNQPLKIYYDTKELVKAWGLLLEERERFEPSEGYQYDLVEFGRQALSNLSHFYQREAALAFVEKDLKRFDAEVARFQELLMDLDALLSTREEFLFGKWLADARRWGATEAEKEYYARYAAMLVTLWGSDNDKYALYDYGWREWCGLVETYYAARWELFWKELREMLVKGEEYADAPAEHWGRAVFRGDELLSRLADWELAYVDNPPEQLPAVAQGDSVNVALHLYKKYLPEFMALNQNQPDPWSDVITEPVEFEMK